MHWQELFKNCKLNFSECCSCRDIFDLNRMPKRCVHSNLFSVSHVWYYYDVKCEIKIKDIDDFYKFHSCNMTSNNYEEFINNLVQYSPKFEYGTILHTCVNIIQLSNNHYNTQSLLYLAYLLLKDKIIDPYETTKYGESTVDIFKYNMKDFFHERVNSKHMRNVDYILFSVLSNINRYTNKIKFVFYKFKTNVFLKKHQTKHNLNLITIVCSPKGQIETNIFKQFLGGVDYINNFNNFMNCH